jgi:hypothetical protein
VTLRTLAKTRLTCCQDAITLAAFSEIMKEGSFPGMQQGHGLTSELVDDEIVAKAAATHLYLSIRREHVIEDTLEQIKQKLTDLKKPLKVKFMNEEGVDQGGVTKEFCQLIVHELFRPEMGLFVYDNDNRHIWFNDHARHKRPLFELTGLVSLALTRVIADHLPNLDDRSRHVQRCHPRRAVPTSYL